ncbi:hypothetical protein RvY_18929 [Ramazzottius varieornatus]|uniref:Uncharacterized protein n=1 Tax=Ramazzottius varieornatus TaxID=947166 RepID=A0A1D1WBX2_RAMVA|nr:hypothetical protein RvY_18929 [Ramazzottius varieornatus]
MGFSRDLPNTNLAEAEHKALKAFFGKNKDPREVAERLLKLYADQVTHLFQCMKNQGKYRVREEFAKDLLLSREEARDERHIVAPGKSSNVSLPELPEFLTTGRAPMFANSWNRAMELRSDWIVQLSDLEWLNFKNR